MDGVDDDVRGRLEAGLDAGGQVTVLAQRLKNRMTLLEVPQDVIGLLEIAKVWGEYRRPALRFR
jgi:hypothetical protein